MKKVLFVISTLNTGGAQRIFSNIIMAMPGDWQIDILLNDSENIEFPYRGTIIDLHMKPEKNKETKLYQLKALFCRFRTLRRLKKQNGYSACVSAMDSANFVNVLTGKKYCKCILTIHGYHVKGWAGKTFEGVADWLVKKTYKKADRVVTVSQGLKDEMVHKYKLPEDMVSVIYNGYGIDEIRELAKEEPQIPIPWNDKEKLLISSGRMEKIKGQWHFLKAFAAVSKEIPQARLVLLGDGLLRPQLEELAKKLHIEDKIFFPGFVKNPFAYYKRADLLVLTSLSEGFSNVIVEAMACDLPCISSDCATGPGEILKPQGKDYGILTPDFDEEEEWNNEQISPKEQLMADAICSVLQDESRYAYYQRAARVRCMDFDMKRIIHEWVALLESGAKHD